MCSSDDQDQNPESSGPLRQRQREEEHAEPCAVMADPWRFQECSDCGNRMSRRAFSCPRCGAPNLGEASIVPDILAHCLRGFVDALNHNGSKPDTPPPSDETPA